MLQKRFHEVAAEEDLIDVDLHQVAMAYDMIAQGGLILVKGDIGYGLIGNSEDSVRRMYALKGRPIWNRCIIVGNLNVLQDVGQISDKRIYDWLHRLLKWTTVAVSTRVNPESRLLKTVTGWVHGQLLREGTVAVFLRTGAFLEKLVERAASECLLLIGTSANRAFQGNNYRFEDVPKEIVNGVDLFFEHGTARYANSEKLATTIVDLTNFSIRRRGVNAERITLELEHLAKEMNYGYSERDR